MNCPTCNKPEMVYGPHTPTECSLNQFQTKVDEQKLRFTSTNKEVNKLLTSDPVLAYKFEYVTPNGKLSGVFVSKAVLEGIGMYRDMQISDMSLAEFLSSLGVTR